MYYTKLVNGEWFNKQAEANYYGVNEKRKLKSNKELVRRKVKPIAVMFSEYNFYLLVCIADEKVLKGRQ